MGGKVWFPDSAFKTAQALKDFNHGENLPVMIFANWRGFSGGTRDSVGGLARSFVLFVWSDSICLLWCRAAGYVRERT